ncbi:MAG: hypothetical protein NC124_20890 [Clostridium sp.]|nr:hypothetical protein [Clostridium sp.]
MNNKIVYVTKEEALSIKKNAVQCSDVFFAEIDGADIKTEEDYVEAMSYAFGFSHVIPKMEIEWCNDYISDLMWIEQKIIVMLIRNYDVMLESNLKLKKDIVADFEEIILPWWEEEVIGHMVGGVPRKFTVYIECAQ